MSGPLWVPEGKKHKTKQCMNCKDERFAASVSTDRGSAGITAAGKNCVLGSAPGINLWRAYPVRNIQGSWCREVIL